MWQLHFPWNKGKQEQTMDPFHTPKVHLHEGLSLKSYLLTFKSKLASDGNVNTLASDYFRKWRTSKVFNCQKSSGWYFTFRSDYLYEQLDR